MCVLFNMADVLRLLVFCFLGVPYGKVPILYVNEKPLSQSVTISRFLGKLFKLSVEDPWMNAVGDEVADAVHDLLPSAVKIIHAR